MPDYQDHYPEAMEDTMNQINSDAGQSIAVNRKDNLLLDISNLETDLKKAQREVLRATATMALSASITPEQANKTQRDIVFLKRDLANKKSEIAQLDE